MASKSHSKKNKKLHKQQTSISETGSKKSLIYYLPAVAFTAVAVLIFYPPFFQGLFFPEEMFVTHVTTALVLLLVAIKKYYQKDFAILSTPLDWAVAAFVAAYLVSLIGAVHPGDAWYGFLKVLNYFAIYLAVSNVVKNFNHIETLSRILLASGVGVAAIGILAAFGLSDYPGAFKGGAVYSTLQYSNATAVFLAVMVLIAVGLWTREKRVSLKFIYLLANSFMILVLLATLSKGAWLVYAIGAILLISGMPKWFRVKAFYGLALPFVIGAAVFVKLYPIITSGQGSAIVYLLVGFFGVVVALAIWELSVYVYKVKGAKLAILSMVLIALLLLIPLGSLGNEVLQNQSISNEISGLLDFESSSFTSRYDFNRWGWDIVKDYPINGTGAGGWDALYHQYQDYLAWTTEVHNHFLQVWVETGTIGFMAWMSIFMVLIWIIVKYRKKSDEDNWILVWGFSSAALALLVHSLIDFDFSIPAVFIIYWVLLALINRAVNYETNAKRANNSIALLGNATLMALLVGVLLVTGIAYSSAIGHAKEADKLLQQMSQAEPEKKVVLFQEASFHYLRAVQLDGFNAAYHAEWANVKAIQYNSFVNAGAMGASEILDEIREEIDNVNRLKPYGLDVRNRLLEVSMTAGDLNLMKDQAEKAVDAQPLNIDTYNMLISVYDKGIDYYQMNNDSEKAMQYAQKVVEVENRLLSRAGSVNSQRPWSGKPLLLSPETQAKVDRAKQLVN